MVLAALGRSKERTTCWLSNVPPEIQSAVDKLPPDIVILLCFPLHQLQQPSCPCAYEPCYQRMSNRCMPSATFSFVAPELPICRIK